MSPTTTQNRTHLNAKFRKAIVWLYVASIVVSVPVVFFISRDQVYASAHKELSLLVDMVKSVREYVAKDLRPDLLEARLFHSPGVSSTVTTGLVAGHFRQLRPDYYVKVASDNPLNLDNEPEPLEESLLERYRADPQVESIVETGVIQGQNFLVSSRPSKAKQGCLVCHGLPAEAPEPLKKKYGTESGYGYSVGEVVGVMTVGVPLQDVNTLVIQRSLAAMAVLALLFSVIAVIISAIVKRSIIAPVVDITEVATALSKGELNSKISQDQDTVELGELAAAFERLRLSVAAAMKRLQR